MEMPAYGFRAMIWGPKCEGRTECPLQEICRVLNKGKSEGDGERVEAQILKIKFSLQWTGASWQTKGNQCLMGLEETNQMQKV